MLGEEAAADVIDWLLAGDPAIRWQVLRDLTDAADADVDRERRRVATEGWGAELLALQTADGSWPSEYHPDSYRGPRTSRHYLYKPEGTATFHCLALLRDFGLPADHESARRACRLVLDASMRRSGGLFVIDDDTDASEMCQTGWGLALLSYFGVDDGRVDTIAGYLLDHQMDDGGWNCQQPEGARHSSMHTTILALEGLTEYAASSEPRPVDVRGATERGREFLLRHRLFRSCVTGEVIEDRRQLPGERVPFTTMVFPTQWHYDVLRGLEHFRVSAAPKDDRLADAIEQVVGARAGGRWALDHRWLDTPIRLEPLGEPSRWNTLRAQRVLRWWRRG
jgi:hypothetical protein